MKKNIATLKIILLALVLAGGLHYAAAAGVWSPPPALPPNDNADAPLNVGRSIASAGYQTKLGGLWINTEVNDPQIVGLNVFGQSWFNGKVKIVDGTQGDKKVLTSDADGLASWKDVGTLTIGTGAAKWYTMGGPNGELTEITAPNPACYAAVNGSGITYDSPTCPAGTFQDGVDLCNAIPGHPGQIGVAIRCRAF